VSQACQKENKILLRQHQQVLVWEICSCIQYCVHGGSLRTQAFHLQIYTIMKHNIGRAETKE